MVFTAELLRRRPTDRARRRAALAGRDADALRGRPLASRPQRGAVRLAAGLPGRTEARAGAADPHGGDLRPGHLRPPADHRGAGPPRGPDRDELQRRHPGPRERPTAPAAHRRASEQRAARLRRALPGRSARDPGPARRERHLSASYGEQALFGVPEELMGTLREISGRVVTGIPRTTLVGQGPGPGAVPPRLGRLPLHAADDRGGPVARPEPRLPAQHPTRALRVLRQRPGPAAAQPGDPRPGGQRLQGGRLERAGPDAHRPADARP